MKNMLAVFRNRNLALLLSGRIVSTTGDWFYAVALSIAIYRYSHHSSFLIGIFWIVRLTPNLLLGPFAGSLADRLGSRRAMITADLTRLVLVGGLALALGLNSSTWPVIFPVAFLVNTMSSLFRPASVALIPLVATREERLHANAAIIQTDALAIILGSALGGFVAGLGLIVPLLVADAASFAVSAAVIWMVRPRQVVDTAPAAAQEEEEVEEPAPGGWLGGFKLIGRRPLLLFSAMVMALPEFASGANVVWIVPYAENHLGFGSAGVGYLYSAMGVGALLGGVVASLLGGSIRLDQLLAGSVIAGGLALVLWGLSPIAALALLFLMAVGIAETVEYAAYETLLQQVAPENMIGRAVGAMESFFFNLMLVGNLTSGLLAAALGVRYAIAGLGVLIVVGAVVAWWNLQIQTINRPDAAALARIPAFEPLPHAIREWAVRRMVPERFHPGGIIIRQGDEGDKFYAIARGAVRVDVASEGRKQTVSQLGPGDFFGEIALLHNVPRTATVEATKPLTVWTLSREDFQELQNRASELKESLLQTATSRMEEDANVSMTLASRT